MTSPSRQTKTHVRSIFQTNDSLTMSNNPKNELQEYAQKRAWPLPKYHTTQLYVQGDNVPVWQSRVVFATGLHLELAAESGPVSGKKIDAEQKAARGALEQLLFQDSLNCTDYNENHLPLCMIDAAPSKPVTASKHKTVYIEKNRLYRCGSHFLCRRRDLPSTSHRRISLLLCAWRQSAVRARGVRRRGCQRHCL